MTLKRQKTEHAERTHKQQVEFTKQDAYRCGYPHINAIDFKEAWKMIVEIDPGLPKEPPENVDPLTSRAIIGLARLVAELRQEWS